jgi:hypothetical protein
MQYAIAAPLQNKITKCTVRVEFTMKDYGGSQGKPNYNKVSGQLHFPDSP